MQLSEAEGKMKFKFVEHPSAFCALYNINNNTTMTASYLQYDIIDSYLSIVIYRTFLNTLPHDLLYLFSLHLIRLWCNENCCKDCAWYGDRGWAIPLDRCSLRGTISFSDLRRYYRQ